MHKYEKTEKLENDIERHTLSICGGEKYVLQTGK